MQLPAAGWGVLNITSAGLRAWSFTESVTFAAQPIHPMVECPLMCHYCVLFCEAPCQDACGRAMDCLTKVVATLCFPYYIVHSVWILPGACAILLTPPCRKHSAVCTRSTQHCMLLPPWMCYMHDFHCDQLFGVVSFAEQHSAAHAALLMQSRL